MDSMIWMRACALVRCERIQYPSSSPLLGASCHLFGHVDLRVSNFKVAPCLACSDHMCESRPKGRNGPHRGWDEDVFIIHPAAEDPVEGPIWHPNAARTFATHGAEVVVVVALLLERQQGHVLVHLRFRRRVHGHTFGDTDVCERTGPFLGLRPVQRNGRGERDVVGRESQIRSCSAIGPGRELSNPGGARNA